MPADGYGSAIAHHGEILQGAFHDAQHRLRYAIVTLPFGRLRSTASFRPDDGGEVAVEPAWRVKAQKGASETLRWLGVEHGGQLTVTSDIPIERGLGSSTADVVSAIVAVADAYGRHLGAEAIATLAVRAEGAVDSIMFGERVVLYANRVGAVVEDFAGALPPLEVLGFDPDGAGIATLSCPPPEYTPAELETFRRLRAALRRAVAVGDPLLAAQVATASARVNQRYHPKPWLPLAERIAGEVGALGVQAAHSGTVLALLFDPADPAMSDRVAAASVRLQREGIADTWRFRSGDGITASAALSSIQEEL